MIQRLIKRNSLISPSSSVSMKLRVCVLFGQCSEDVNTASYRTRSGLRQLIQSLYGNFLKSRGRGCAIFPWQTPPSWGTVAIATPLVKLDLLLGVPSNKWDHDQLWFVNPDASISAMLIVKSDIIFASSSALSSVY